MTQIPQHQALSMTAKISLNGDKNGDLAALGMIGQRYAYAGLMKTDEGNRLVLYTGKVINKEYEGEAEEQLEVSVPYDDQQVYLRMELSEDKTYRFAWSKDGIRYTRLGQCQPLFRATWTGAKLCLWSANKENQNSEGYGEYDFVHIEDRSRG